jgi:uncharacterized membrane protein
VITSPAQSDVVARTFADLVDGVGRGFEAAGVVVVVIGCLLAFFAYGVASPREEAAYRALRRGLGRAILLGLELFVAGDIIRTVTVNPSFTSAGVLAIIVGIRTFLSFTLQVEIEGRWPWQRDQNQSPDEPRIN